MKLWIGLLFGAAVVAQVIVPGSLLAKHELTLRQGAPWKFKTAPVDPYDAFRGRYVALRFQESRAPVAPGSRITPGRRACAMLGTDSAGFARITEITDKAPPGKSYLCVTVASVAGAEARVLLPFDRYYMEERRAPEAENAYRRSNGRPGGGDAYALVRVRNGLGVIENLYLDGKPLR